MTISFLYDTNALMLCGWVIDEWSLEVRVLRLSSNVQRQVSDVHELPHINCILIMKTSFCYYNKKA